ncbi:hypothetical protein GCM10018781_46150 [Kitasatospora indigofera]|uniref:Uncharacterized protein n=1 Tax=Kitasatospora indigofera TaxID=67307 RepID=A0A919G1L3_9ACTN|nr:hypothetical protein GCM10018781_46150 [Kitasatospora indigofera]
MGGAGGGGEGGTGEGEGEEGALGRVHALPNDPDGSEVTGGAGIHRSARHWRVCTEPAGAAEPTEGLPA